MSPPVKIILIQPRPVSQLDSPENVDRALKLLESCRGQQADLICFPEYFPFSGDASLAQAARELKSYLVAGLVEESQGRRYNTATLFDRQGNLVGRQRKCTLGNLERRGFGVTPGSGFQVLDTDFGRLGLAVCIDFWGQPEAARQLTDQGADLVVNPSIFPILRGHWTLGALVRAFDNYLPVVGVNTASFTAEIAGRTLPHAGRRLLRHPTPRASGRRGTLPPGAQLGRPQRLDHPQSRRRRTTPHHPLGPGRPPPLAPRHLGTVRDTEVNL